MLRQLEAIVGWCLPRWAARRARLRRELEVQRLRERGLAWQRMAQPPRERRDGGRHLHAAERGA